jgi:hypothetical protein
VQIHQYRFQVSDKVEKVGDEFVPIPSLPLVICQTIKKKGLKVTSNQAAKKQSNEPVGVTLGPIKQTVVLLPVSSAPFD